MTTDTAVMAEPKRAEFQALTALSVGRRGDKEKGADFVLPGETVWLTEEESAGLLDRRHHMVPVIRPAAERNNPLPRVTARMLFRPVAGPGQFGVRPDPAGATRVIEMPDMNGPVPEVAFPKVAAAAVDVPVVRPPEGELLNVTDPDAHREGATQRQPRRAR